MRSTVHRFGVFICSMTICTCVLAFIPEPVRHVSLDYLRIIGKTNVSDFQLYYTPEQKVSDDPEKLIFQTGDQEESIEVLVPVTCIKADNRVLEKDFYELLKLDQFPYVRLSLDSGKILNVLEGNDSSIEIFVTIVGVTKLVEFKVQCYGNELTGWNLEGIETINLGAFGLEAPEKLAGLIKVDPKIIINFGMNIDQENISLIIK
ncbi:MAG: YceI family protein [Bacteroidales bacterium]|nr:YceI family protein [Bacteroidales bacterium]